MDLNVRLKYEINTLSLLLRAKSLNEITLPTTNNKNLLKTYKKDFDFNQAKLILEHNAEEIVRCCSLKPADFIVNRLHAEMGNAVERTMIPTRRTGSDDRSQTMKACDESFKKYLKALASNDNNNVISMMSIKENEINWTLKCLMM